MFSITVNPEIFLGLLERRHAFMLFALVEANRAHLRPWLPWVDGAQTVDDSEAFIMKKLKCFADGIDVPVGIFYQHRLVGHMSLMEIKPGHCAEIGYWISADCEGKGIVVASTKTLIDYAFNELDLERIEILCRTTNVRSKAISQRLKFVLEGIVRHGEIHSGVYYDFEQYSLLNGDYNPQLQ